MKKYILFITVLLLYFTSLNSQTKISIGGECNLANASFSFPKHSSFYNLDIIEETNDLGKGFFIEMNSHLVENFHLAVTLGSFTLRKNVVLSYENEFNDRLYYELNGSFNIHSLYMGLYPEYRIGERNQFIINVGFGIHDLIINKFQGDFLILVDDEDMDDSDPIEQDARNVLYFSLSTNLGYAITLGKVNCTLEFGYDWMSPIKFQGNIPRMKIRQWGFQASVSYPLNLRNENDKK